MSLQKFFLRPGNEFRLLQNCRNPSLVQNSNRHGHDIHYRCAQQILHVDVVSEEWWRLGQFCAPHVGPRQWHLSAFCVLGERYIQCPECLLYQSFWSHSKHHLSNLNNWAKFYVMTSLQNDVHYPVIVTFLGTMVRKPKVFPTASHGRSGSESSSDVWTSWIEVKFCTRTRIIGDGPRLFAKENRDFWFSSGFFWRMKIVILVMCIRFSMNEKTPVQASFFISFTV